MSPLDRKAIAAMLEAKEFEHRDFAVAAHAEALAAGKKREANSWAAHIRKSDRVIVQYGFKRRQLDQATLDRINRLIAPRTPTALAYISGNPRRIS